MKFLQCQSCETDFLLDEIKQDECPRCTGELKIVDLEFCEWGIQECPFNEILKPVLHRIIETLKKNDYLKEGKDD